MARPPRNFNSGRFSNHTIRANNFIRAREVFLIDEEGKPIGNLPLPEALSAARRVGLDLVEISPNANPPVCKILDYGKYRYEIAKKEKDSKKNTGASKLKEMQFHLNIDPHDYGIKLRRAEGFMWKGMKVKFSLFLRGRENLHKNLAEDLMRRVRADLLHVGVADQEPKLVGKNISMMLAPLPLHKRTRRFTEENIEVSDEDEEAEDAAEAKENAEAASREEEAAQAETKEKVNAEAQARVESGAQNSSGNSQG